MNAPVDEADPWLTLAEIAGELRVNPATVRLWISRGQLDATRPGQRKLLVRRSELDRMLAQPGPDGRGQLRVEVPAELRLRSSPKPDRKASASTRWPLRSSPAGSTGAPGIAVERSPSSPDTHPAAPRATVVSPGCDEPRRRARDVSDLADLGSNSCRHQGPAPLSTRTSAIGDCRSKRPRHASSAWSSNSAVISAGARALAQATKATAPECLPAARVRRTRSELAPATAGAGVALELPPRRTAELVANGAPGSDDTASLKIGAEQLRLGVLGRDPIRAESVGGAHAFLAPRPASTDARLQSRP